MGLETRIYGVSGKQTPGDTISFFCFFLFRMCELSIFNRSTLCCFVNKVRLILSPLKEQTLGEIVKCGGNSVNFVDGWIDEFCKFTGNV